MHFQSLSVLQFRNHAAGSYDLAPNVHAFVGPNGIGKTNLLEALHYLCMARGFRSNRSADREAIQHGANYWMVEGKLVGAMLAAPATERAQQAAPLQEIRIQCTYLDGKGKRVLVDGRPLARLSDHVGRIPVVTLLPEDAYLIHDAAAQRRRWLDSVLAQGSTTYLQALSRYEHALDQRNALLARWAEPGGPSFDTDELALWDAPLAQAGAVVQGHRAQFVQDFAPVLLAAYHRIANPEQRAELPALTYETAVPGGMYEDFLFGLQRAQLADRGAGRSTWGTHRDDLSLLLNATPLRQHGSQGQQKTFLIALKLAQHAYLHQSTGRTPLLLFDDVFDRLDPQRAARIFQLLCTELPGQKILTDTTPERVTSALSPYSATSITILSSLV